VAAPDGIIAVIPHLLGFHPADSVVVLGIGGDPAIIRLGCRYDVPAATEPSAAARIASHAAAALGGQPAESAAAAAVVVGYGPRHRVEPVMEALAGTLTAARIEVKDVLQVHKGRYWSLLCDDPRCCPPGGTAIDPAAHPAAVALDAAGLAARADRGALERSLEPVPDAAIDQAWQRAVRRARTLIESALAGEKAQDDAAADPLRLVAASGRRAVRTAIGVYRGGGEIASAEQLAWLGLTLTDLRVRDDAWSRMNPQYRHDHQRLWTSLVRRLPPAFAAAPAALLAFTAWQSGDGPLAAIAVDRALQADPEYSMAKLIGQALQTAAPPSAAVPPLTPRQVAASYRNRRAASPGGH
jgi:hypothetical protein